MIPSKAHDKQKKGYKPIPSTSTTKREIEAESKESNKIKTAPDQFIPHSLNP